MAEALGNNPESKGWTSVEDILKSYETGHPIQSVLQFGGPDSEYILKIDLEKGATIAYRDENGEWIEELL